MIARFDGTECTRDARPQNRPVTVSGVQCERHAHVGEGGAAMVTRLSASDASFFTWRTPHPDVCRLAVDPAQAPQRAELRNTARHGRTAAAADSALPPEGARGDPGLARPVWVDDRDFDITYHIRRSALPSPGSDAQLHELVARLGSRPLDKSRPLWEMYLVEGLARNRVAIYTKSHQALVNGMTALEIGHVIADRTQKPPAFGEDIWIPAREPGDANWCWAPSVSGSPGRPRSWRPCAPR